MFCHAEESRAAPLLVLSQRNNIELLGFQIPAIIQGAIASPHLHISYSTVTPPVSILKELSFGSMKTT